jgi:hypothetical protein
MSEAQLSTILDMQQAANFVPPVDDASIGWEAFFKGHDISRCRNQAQRSAWVAAREHGYKLLLAERNHADYGAGIESDHSWIRTGC